MEERQFENINYLKSIIIFYCIVSEIKLMATDKRQFLNIN